MSTAEVRYKELIDDIGLLNGSEVPALKDSDVPKVNGVADRTFAQKSQAISGSDEQTDLLIDIIDKYKEHKVNPSNPPNEAPASAAVADPSKDTEVKVETGEGVTVNSPDAEKDTENGTQVAPQRAWKVGKFLTNFVGGLGMDLVDAFRENFWKTAAVTAACIAVPAALSVGVVAAGFATAATVASCWLWGGVAFGAAKLLKTAKTMIDFKQGEATAEQVEESGRDAGQGFLSVIPILGRMKILRGVQSAASKITRGNIKSEADILKFADEGISVVDDLAKDVPKAVKAGRVKELEAIHKQAKAKQAEVDEILAQMKTAEMKEKASAIKQKVEAIEGNIAHAAERRKTHGVKRQKKLGEQVTEYTSNMDEYKTQIAGLADDENPLTLAEAIMTKLKEAEQVAIKVKSPAGKQKLQTLEAAVMEVKESLVIKSEKYLKHISAEMDANRQTILSAQTKVDAKAPMEAINRTIAEVEKLEGLVSHPNVIDQVKILKAMAIEASAHEAILL